MSDLGLIKERAKARKLYREYEAILALTNRMTVGIKKNTAKSYEAINQFKKSELRRRLHELEGEVSKLRREYGVQVSGEELVRLLDIAEARPGLVLNFMKHDLRRVFKNYELAFPDFVHLSEHAYVVIDAGQVREQFGEVEWGAHEVVLYEDMCALFNLASERCKKLNRKADKKVITKAALAIARGTIVAAFNFLESYLNGIAIDYCFNNVNKLDGKTKRFLTEWDEDRKRMQFVSLRDKLLQYPRVILSAEHPPLQESNCEELAYLLKEGKSMRDSIVHASVIAKGGTASLDDIEPIIRIEFKHVEQVVDSVIKLVRKVERLTHGDERRIGWLYNRGEDGLFPQQAFD